MLRSEVDASGFDIALECAGVLRHVQLKTSRTAARAGGQKVALALGEKPSGCVIWILRDENRQQCRVQLKYLFFGSRPGDRLPDLQGFKIARHTKPDANGVKKDRPGLRVVPKSRFQRVDTMSELLRRLFGF